MCGSRFAFIPSIARSTTRKVPQQRGQQESLQRAAMMFVTHDPVEAMTLATRTLRRNTTPNSRSASASSRSVGPARHPMP